MMVSDSEGRTPLHWAVDRGHLNSVEILVNANADVNAQVLDSTFNASLSAF
jgi:ankyrin repeat protein